MNDPAKQHGGRREGSGRKSHAETFATEIGDFVGACAGHLDAAFENLRKAADGESKRVERKRVAAGMLTRKDVARDAQGVPIQDKNGKMTVIEVPKFPGLDPTEMVLVEEKEADLPEDVGANGEIISRVMGRHFVADGAIETPGEALAPADLESLSDDDLDALEKIALRLSDGGPGGGPGPDPGGEGPPG